MQQRVQLSSRHDVIIKNPIKNKIVKMVKNRQIRQVRMVTRSSKVGVVFFLIFRLIYVPVGYSWIFNFENKIHLCGPDGHLHTLR